MHHIGNKHWFVDLRNNLQIFENGQLSGVIEKNAEEEIIRT